MAEMFTFSTLASSPGSYFFNGMGLGARLLRPSLFSKKKKLRLSLIIILYHIIWTGFMWYSWVHLAGLLWASICATPNAVRGIKRVCVIKSVGRSSHHQRHKICILVHCCYVVLHACTHAPIPWYYNIAMATGVCTYVHMCECCML